jgi:hypothetical protein
MPKEVPMSHRLSLALLAWTMSGCAAEVEDIAADEGVDGVAVTKQGLISYSRPGFVTTSSTYRFANRCAGDPVGDIGKLTQRPDYVLAYRSGHSSCGVDAPFACPAGMNCDAWIPRPSLKRSAPAKHRQGIQRLYRGGINYLFVSNSVEYRSTEPAWSRFAGFETIDLATKDNLAGKLGSNVTPSTWPPCEDHIAKYTPYSNSSYDHAGGIAVMGEFIAVPFVHASPRDARGRTRLYDLANPVAPAFMYSVDRTRGSASELNNAGSAGLTRLDDLKYLLMVWGNDAREVEVYVSHDGTIASQFRSVAQRAMPGSFDGYQGTVFVTGCDGSLYVAATHRNSDGEDWVDLWQVTFDEGSDYFPRFAKVASRHLYCLSDVTEGKQYCNFAAAAGIHVDTNGRLILYATEHYNDAFPVDQAFGVKLREFASF